MNKAPAYFEELYVMVTEYCPLRCPYCYIKDRENPAAIDLGTVEKALALYQRRPRLIFFGGEPLIQLDLMAEIVKNFRPQVNKFQVVTSAAVNFDRFVREVYTPDLFDVQVSWDGTGEKGDLDRFVNAGIGLQVRCVIDDNNVRDLPRIYDTFNELRGKKILGDCVIAHVPIRDPKFSFLLKSSLLQVLNRIEKGGYIPQFISRYIANVASGREHTSCDAGRYLVVRPNGDLYPCTILSQTPHFNLGNVHGEIDFEKMEKLHHIPDECRNCRHRVLCDGGCRYERLSVYGTLDCAHGCGVTGVIHDTVRDWYDGLRNADIDRQVLQQEKFWIDYETGGGT